MKRFLFLTTVCMFSIWGIAQIGTDTYVEVLYFHGKQRCVTCKAIEKHTKEVVNTDLAELVQNGQLRFKEVDISTPKGERLAEKYRVSWSSLYINKWKNGKEERNDMTRFGFQKARNDAATFKKELQQKISRLLK
ncbi:nitrophenyl compound nitroreductase subunit ArsF family protein [uncultured Bacteroides sp.]|uniref:nitrophenyl compound nitroreductase subunit ArsF family protein n=1 Tax=uncultured Bacteroides sp. TaxID=162156 RepID=UPI0026002C9C|nr:nitrophenyl compound nitroreductase subunit ArsF family protein [uncultured Bacteroides sp.]